MSFIFLIGVAMIVLLIIFALIVAYALSSKK